MYSEQQNSFMRTCSAETLQELKEQNVAVCAIDLKVYHNNYEECRKLNTRFILMVENTEELNEVLLNYPKKYFMIKPYPFENLFAILNCIQDETVLFIKKPKQAVEKILLTDLNYIDILQRNLCFHCTDKDIKGIGIRTSFEKEIQEYKNIPELYFVPPSLLINLANIKEFAGDNHILFKQGEGLYVPQKTYRLLLNKWEHH